MGQYNVVQPCVVGQFHHVRPAVIDVDDDVAAPLVAAGCLTPYRPWAKDGRDVADLTPAPNPYEGLGDLLDTEPESDPEPADVDDADAEPAEESETGGDEPDSEPKPKPRARRRREA